jgi:large subunit ribosomal protein L19
VSRLPIIEQVEENYLKKKVPAFKVGDTIRVKTQIIEGDKQRMQALTGTVVARKGTGLSETFTLFRTAYGSTMERVFLLHSPRITQIEVVRPGKVRRAKLYHLRRGSGKKIKERYVAQEAGAEEPAAPAAAQPSVE